MNRNILLLWSPDCGWRVYDYLVSPDISGLPEYWWRNYCVSEKSYAVTFSKLVALSKELQEKKLIPFKSESERIFPSLESVIS